MKEELLRLAERCEKATGPDRDLDEAIRAALGFDKVLLGVGDGLCATEEDYGASEFTHSLDAAITLVPDRCDFHIYRANAAVWDASKPKRPTGVKRAKAATPALALCAAALRASVKEQNNGK